MSFISIVVPMYNEEEVIMETYKRLKAILLNNHRLRI